MDWCGFIVMFLSAVWTLILTAPIHFHWWASDGMLHFSKSDEETNLEWPESEVILGNVWVNYSFNNFLVFNKKISLFFMKNNPFVCSCMNACVWCESFTGIERTLVLVWFRLVSSGLWNVNTVSALWRMHKWNDAKSVEKIPEIILSSQSPASAHIKTAGVIHRKWINIEQNWSRSDRNKTKCFGK